MQMIFFRYLEKCCSNVLIFVLIKNFINANTNDIDNDDMIITTGNING